MARARSEDCGRPRRADASRLLAVSEAGERQRCARPHCGEFTSDLSFPRTGQGLGQDLGLHWSLLSFARPYVVLDKTDPSDAQQKGAQQILASYRQSYPVFVENEDFVVFRNDTARPYITAYGRACLYAGDVRKSAALALALSARNWPLVQAKEPSVNAVPNATVQKYEKTYGEDSSPFPPLNEAAP